MPVSCDEQGADRVTRAWKIVTKGAGVRIPEPPETSETSAVGSEGPVGVS